MPTPYRIPSDRPDEAPRPPRNEENPLGALVSTHRPGRSLGVFVFAAIVGVFVAQLLQHASFAPVLLEVVLASGAVLVAGELVYRQKPVLEIWDGGLVVRRRRTDPRVVRFDEIDTVTYDPTTSLFSLLELLGPRSPEVTIATFSGGRLLLQAGLSDKHAILAALDRHVTRPLVAPALRALANGDELLFGPVILRKGKLVTSEGMMPLEDLDVVHARASDVRFYKKGTNWPPFAVVPLHAIPHPRLLLAVLAGRVPVEDTTTLAE